MSAGRFFITQNDLFDEVMELGCIGIAVYQLMRRFADGATGELWLSPEGIAERLGKTPKYIAGIVSKLVKIGVVELRKHGNDRRYFLRQNADISGKIQTNRQNADISARNKEYQEPSTKPISQEGLLVFPEISNSPATQRDSDFATPSAAADKLMVYLGLATEQNKAIVLRSIDALMERGWPTLRDACREIAVRVRRYRARDGPKETRYFLADGIFLNPESTWGIHGRPVTTETYPRRISATEARQQRNDDSTEEALRILRERRAEARRDCRSTAPAGRAGERGG